MEGFFFYIEPFFFKKNRMLIEVKNGHSISLTHRWKEAQHPFQTSKNADWGAHTSLLHISVSCVAAWRSIYSWPIAAGRRKVCFLLWQTNCVVERLSLLSFTDVPSVDACVSVVALTVGFPVHCFIWCRIHEFQEDIVKAKLDLENAQEMIKHLNTQVRMKLNGSI